jgi:hypothetical protein
MRIKQAYVSPSLSQFKNEFLECWNLDDYNNIEEPTVFYGLYYDWDGDKKWMKDTSRDIEIFNNHNGLKVLLCGGIEYNSGVFDKIDNYILYHSNTIIPLIHGDKKCSFYSHSKFLPYPNWFSK